MVQPRLQHHLIALLSPHIPSPQSHFMYTLPLQPLPRVANATRVTAHSGLPGANGFARAPQRSRPSLCKCFHPSAAPASRELWTGLRIEDSPLLPTHRKTSRLSKDGCPPQQRSCQQPLPKGEQVQARREKYRDQGRAGKGRGCWKRGGEVCLHGGDGLTSPGWIEFQHWRTDRSHYLSLLTTGLATTSQGLV